MVLQRGSAFARILLPASVMGSALMRQDIRKKLRLLESSPTRVIRGKQIGSKLQLETTTRSPAVTNPPSQLSRCTEGPL